MAWRCVPWLVLLAIAGLAGCGGTTEEGAATSFKSFAEDNKHWYPFFKAKSFTYDVKRTNSVIQPCEAEIVIVFEFSGTDPVTVRANYVYKDRDWRCTAITNADQAGKLRALGEPVGMSPDQWAFRIASCLRWHRPMNENEFKGKVDELWVQKQKLAENDRRTEDGLKHLLGQGGSKQDPTELLNEKKIALKRFDELNRELFKYVSTTGGADS